MANSQRKGTRRGWCFSGLNIRRFIVNGVNKRAEVERLIDEHKLDILVIGESWLTGTLDQQLEQHEQLQIDGFSYVRFDRTNRAGGGLIIYIRRIIQFSVTSFFEWTETNLQYVELAIDRPFKFDLVAIYSPPYPPTKQMVQRLMDAFLKRSKDSINPVMLIGDLNIARERGDPVPILRHLGFYRGDGRTVAALFRRFEECYYAEALITVPTCDTKSCIDHIITNIHRVSAHRPVPITGRGVDRTPIDQRFADHALIWCRVGRKPPLRQQQQSYYLLRLSDGESEQTQIDNNTGGVGQFKNLSQNAQVITRLIEDGNDTRISCKVTYCDKKVDTCDEMKQHVHENHFPCTVCDKVFKSKCGPDHMERKHGIYMCRDVHCNDLRFNDSQERDAHENDGNHYMCKECKLENRRAFSSKAAYKKHQKSHRQQPKIMKGFMVK